MRRISDDLPHFEESLTCFVGYQHIDLIPRAVFRRMNEIIRNSRIDLDVACDHIALALQTSREKVRQKLLAYPGSDRGSKVPKKERWH